MNFLSKKLLLLFTGEEYGYLNAAVAVPEGF